MAPACHCWAAACQPITSACPRLFLLTEQCVSIAHACIGRPPARTMPPVGEFRQLVLWAQEDAKRCDSVKRMLKLAKGWEEARDHVLKVGGGAMQCNVGGAGRGWRVGLGRGWALCSGHLPAPTHFTLPALPDSRDSWFKASPPPCHTLQAVQTDNRLRAFFPDDSLTHGLLFGCQGARPLLGAPLGAWPPACLCLLPCMCC